MTAERMLAAELRDMTKSVDASVKSAVKELGAQVAKATPPAPQVTVHVPETPVTVKVPEALPPNFVINIPQQTPTEVRFDVPQLPAPVVNVKQPVVNIMPPQPRAYRCEITSRDESGFILSFTITPIT